MKYIQPMTAVEFSELLCKMKTDDVVEFGLDPGYVWPDEIPEPHDVTNWYFAKKIYIPGYDSRFILIDYCGGEAAIAIPLNCYREDSDEDDARIVLDHVESFYTTNDCVVVFVEMEDNK